MVIFVGIRKTFLSPFLYHVCIFLCFFLAGSSSLTRSKLPFSIIYFISHFNSSQKITRAYSTSSPFPPIPADGNTPLSIKAKIGKNLHLAPQHPLNYIKSKIESHFRKTYKNPDGSSLFSFFDNFPPQVSVKMNFDDLLFPNDHVGRSPTDTYYLSPTTVLRTHTSAHQSSLFLQSNPAFLVTGDVYRRDEIDSSHYPVFHQMEGAKLFSLPIPSSSSGTPPLPDKPTKFYYDDQDYKSHPDIAYVAKDLKNTLEGLVKSVFGNVETRWVDTYFPFTTPSFELEIYFKVWASWQPSILFFSDVGCLVGSTWVWSGTS